MTGSFYLQVIIRLICLVECLMSWRIVRYILHISYVSLYKRSRPIYLSMALNNVEVSLSAEARQGKNALVLMTIGPSLTVSFSTCTIRYRGQLTPTDLSVSEEHISFIIEQSLVRLAVGDPCDLNSRVLISRSGVDPGGGRGGRLPPPQ